MFDENGGDNHVSSEQLGTQLMSPILDGQDIPEANIPATHLAWMIIGFFVVFIALGMTYSELNDYMDDRGGSLILGIVFALVSIVVVGSWLKSCIIVGNEMKRQPEMVLFNGHMSLRRVRADGNQIFRYVLPNGDIELVLTCPKGKNVIRSIHIEGGLMMIESGVNL